MYLWIANLRLGNTVYVNIAWLSATYCRNKIPILNGILDSVKNLNIARLLLSLNLLIQYLRLVSCSSEYRHTLKGRLIDSSEAILSNARMNRSGNVVLHNISIYYYDLLDSSYILGS